MPEVIFTGSAGRIEGRFHPAKQKNAPIAIILHPHPQFGGTMNHQIIYQLYYAFVHRGFSALRFNFRGVGRSQGSFDHGTGELSDAAAALDYDIAADVLELLRVDLPDEDDESVWPEGDLEILADLGLPGVELEVIVGEVDLYPDEQLQMIAQRCGFVDELTALLDEI